MVNDRKGTWDTIDGQLSVFQVPNLSMYLVQVCMFPALISRV